MRSCSSSSTPSRLENPPLLVVSDIERIRIHTNWTNTVSVRYDLTLDDLLVPKQFQLLKEVFRGSPSLCKGESRAELTSQVAKEFAGLAQELEADGHAPQAVAHFVNRLVFCMFAEDTGILPKDQFKSLLDATRRKPDSFPDVCGGLFSVMHKGGFFGAEPIEWFNGGLFDSVAVLPLSRAQIDGVREAASRDWGAIDPSILGTLFERGLDPAKRSQLGAHYTDPKNIMRIVEPVVLRPLQQEWEAAKTRIEGYKSRAKKEEVLTRYLERLRGVTVLDPACGSGNFLYMALRGLKDLEYRVLFEAEELGLARRYPELGPEVLRGIEINPFAAELARVSIWIGELQWQLEHGFNVSRDPILKSLDTIENRDALLVSEGAEAGWPDAEFIIGNPPFLGGKLLRRELGNKVVDRMFVAYEGKVPREADLCAYWFEKARAQIESGASKRAGLIATQGIRGGANRRVLQYIKETGDIFLAWSDLDWVLEGANVHVSIVGFDGGEDEVRTLDGAEVVMIAPNLTSDKSHSAQVLEANLNVAQQGTKQVGKFSIDEETALRLLVSPALGRSLLKRCGSPLEQHEGPLSAHGRPLDRRLRAGHLD